ncbi:MAG TPA: M15 family metallopeptidase, partial [Candidatus Bathyarchaeia archaeon]|nr:M15 family metallopeptidase [Candidatus Bathyarchaeia archaeon]
MKRPRSPARATSRLPCEPVALAALVTLLGCAASARPGAPPALQAPVASRGTAGENAVATEASAARADDLVDLATLDRSIVLDLRYATSDNFTRQKLYPVARCLLRRDVAERLVRVQRALRAQGLGLAVWDCYRPISVQQRFWALVPDPRYVAEPVF